MTLGHNKAKEGRQQGGISPKLVGLPSKKRLLKEVRRPRPQRKGEQPMKKPGRVPRRL